MRAILTYHSVDRSGSVISVTPEVFARQIEWLSASRMRVVSMHDILTVATPGHSVAITFDDAFTNFRDEAWPVLRAHGMPVTLFVPTRFVGGANSWGELPGGAMPRLDILGWDALGRLQEEGVTLGGHSRTHPDLRRLSGTALDDEIAGSLDDIERQTGRRPESFCYPYGFRDDGVTAHVRAACRYACTTELRPLGAGESPHLLPRLDVFYLCGPGKLEAFGTPAFHAYLRARGAVRELGARVRQWRRG